MFGCSKPCNRIFVDQILDNNIDDRSWPGVPARCMLPSGKSTADGGKPLVIEHYRSPGMAFGRSKYLSVLDSPIITISHEFYGAQRAPLRQRIWLVSHGMRYTFVKGLINCGCKIPVRTNRQYFQPYHHHIFWIPAILSLLCTLALLSAVNITTLAICDLGCIRGS